MEFVSHFFAGAFLCNFIPHLAAGLQGQFFPTPFARLHGARDSSPVVNVLWGSFNLAAGVALLDSSPVSLELGAPLVVFSIGFLGLGVFLAWHFNKVMGHKRG
jgi:hypothetical protein